MHSPAVPRWQQGLGPKQPFCALVCITCSFSMSQATDGARLAVTSAPPDATHWTCPLCLDLVYKPCVNVCGHLFCFWCLHKAMSPYAKSHCPICRQDFCHFPAVCGKLHLLLGRHFTQQYAERRRETLEEVEDLGLTPDDPVALPPILAVEGGTASASVMYTAAELLCDSPSCGALLWHPVVLNCGHVVCQPCMGRTADGGSSTCPACSHSIPALPAVCKQLDELLGLLWPAQQAQRAAEVAACSRAAVSPGTSTGAVVEGASQQLQHQHQQAEGIAPPGQAPMSCSQAGLDGLARVQQGPTVASPREAAAAGSQPPPAAALGRPAAQGVQQAVPSPGLFPGHGAGADGGTAAGPSAGAEGADSGPATPRGTPAEGAGPGAAAVSPSLFSAIERRRLQGGPQSAVAQRLEENLRSLTGEKYVHHGVGCDVCGVYPIQGRRYRCRDCPEAVGFDLCGSCWDKGVPPSVGRFNQRHTASHRMELVRPRVTAMHLLQAANPELPMEQLMWLLELAVGAGEEHQQQQQPGAQQQQQQAGDQQQQEVGQEQREEPSGSPAREHEQRPQGQGGGNGGPEAVAVDEEPAIPMPHWRGPRPAPDPTAQEPSPSAIPGRDEEAGAEEGGGAEMVFIPLETVAALLAGEEEENSVHVED